MSNKTIEVVAFSLDTQRLIMYTPTGESFALLQGTAELPEIVQILSTHNFRKKPVITITLPSEPENVYQSYENESEGLVRFFKLPIRALKKILGIPNQSRTSTVIHTTKTTNEDRRKEIEEVMAHAITPKDRNFTTPPIPHEETVVAVVNETIIPKAEALGAIVKEAVNRKQTKGLDAFMKRLAKVQNERAHSAQDLLTFLEKANLPIAADGSIIIYKVLKDERKDPDGIVRYSDTHTGLVRQRAGTLVQVLPELVDLSRYRECSNGLHVARMSYLTSFSSEHCFLGKINPEDVMAVPHQDPNKMRVSAYQLLFKLLPEDYDQIRRGKAPDASAAFRKALGAALAGDYPAPLETVTIQGHRGTNLRMVIHNTEVVSEPSTKAPEATSFDPEISGKDTRATVPVKVSQVAEAVGQTGTKTRLQVTAELYDTFHNASSSEKKAAAQELLTFKKKTKKGWEALGLSDKVEAEVQKALKG